MDRCFQDLDHSPPDDPGRLARCDAGLPCLSQHTRHKRLHGRSVTASVALILPPANLPYTAQTQGRNIRHYSNYLSERARAYRETKIDWVRAKDDRLENLSVEKGLLRETEVVQYQLSALLECDVMEIEPENEIAIAVFRLLVLDLLSLFQALNQGLINVLSKTLFSIRAISR